MENGHYNHPSTKLINGLNKYLKKLEGPLKAKYSEKRALPIILRAKEHYPDIVTKIPYFDTPMYEALVLECSRMLAVKKAMRENDLDVEEFVRFNIGITKEKNNRIPKIIRKLAGWIFLSKAVRFFLTRVGRSASANGWPTEVSGSKKGDNYNMKVCTKECGMVEFIKAVGEVDLITYCSFFDFTTAESMGIGIKQLSSIDSGECVYTMSRKGSVEWPENIQKILTV